MPMNDSGILAYVGPTRRLTGLRFTTVASLLAVAPSAFAALGEPAASVESDRQRMSAQAVVSPAQPMDATAVGQSVHEMRAPTGTIVREYLNADGKVFAVSWQGPFKPDLRLLLGPHFASLERAPREAGAARTRGVHRLEQDDLVIESGGRPRAFFGRAWLKSLLPTGLDASVIR